MKCQTEGLVFRVRSVFSQAIWILNTCSPFMSSQKIFLFYFSGHTSVLLFDYLCPQYKCSLHFDQCFNNKQQTFTVCLESAAGIALGNGNTDTEQTALLPSSLRLARESPPPPPRHSPGACPVSVFCRCRGMANWKRIKYQESLLRCSNVHLQTVFVLEVKRRLILTIMAVYLAKLQGPQPLSGCFGQLRLNCTMLITT